MSELPYAKEMFVIALSALFSYLIARVVFKRQQHLEKNKITYDAASVTIIEYIDEIIKSLSDLRYSTPENEGDARMRLINTIKYQQVISSRLYLLDNKKLIDDFGKFMKIANTYSQTTGDNKLNVLNLEMVTTAASEVLEHLLRRI